MPSSKASGGVSILLEGRENEWSGKWVSFREVQIKQKVSSRPKGARVRPSTSLKGLEGGIYAGIQTEKKNPVQKRSAKQL